MIDSHYQTGSIVLTVNRAGRPGLIALAERARMISNSSSEPLANRELLYEAVRSVAMAEAAVSRYAAARSSAIPGELERLALLHDAGGLTDGEFAAAKRRIIGELASTSRSVE